MNILPLEIQLSLLFQSLRFQRVETTTLQCLLLNTLTTLQADPGCCLGCPCIGAALRLCLPHTDPAVQKLRAECFAHQDAFQEEINHRDIPSVVVDVDCSPA